MTVDIDALIARMRQPGPVDDDPRDWERDDYSPAEIDQRGDAAADRHEKEMDARWER